MSILQRIKLWFIPKEFPRVVKNHWYCGSWKMYVDKLREDGLYPEDISLDDDNLPLVAKNEVAFNHFRMGLHGRDKRGLIDGLIPAITINGQVGLYRLASNRYRNTSFYDGAMWDDGYHIDLELVRVIPYNEFVAIRNKNNGNN